VHITSFKQDLIWWRQILACGHNSWQIWDWRPTVTLLADSSQTRGGSFCSGLWLYRNWKLDTTLASTHINVNELAIIREALMVWGPLLSGHKIRVCSDNTSAVAFLNKGTSRNPGILNFKRQ
jgi:hypothetical protein